MSPLFRHRESPGEVTSPSKLHVGCGTAVIPDWCNVDIQDLPGVDVVLDVTRGLPFRDVNFIFCEHFIEHLRIDQALAFLGGCRAALRPGGVMRLSTPNLDWVVQTHYHLDNPEPTSRIGDALILNRAFYAWGHQFLYNAQTLEAALLHCGFSHLRTCRYGISQHPELCNLERHEQYGSTPDLPDVLVVEASAGHEPPAEEDDGFERRVRTEFLDHLAWRLDT